MLKPLEPVRPKEGEKVWVRIEEGLRKRLKDLISVSGELSEEELERYLREIQQSHFL